MPLLPRIKSCVRRKDKITRRLTKVFFNVKIADAFKSENIASQLKSLLVYTAREGVTVTDLFRRPGNIQCIKKIIADLEAGIPVNWKEYNFYTLANLAKRFLLCIDGGLLGKESEQALIDCLEIPDIDERNARMKSIITSQPRTVQQLLTLLFGTWFRMIYHTEVNAMSVEAVAKSVAGSIFPSSTVSAESVEKASKVMEILIVGFASTEIFGRDLIDYFTRETNTSISRIEKFKYEFRFPKNIPRQYSVQMFRQMLVDESRKHGFDILQDGMFKSKFHGFVDEVTEEQFEQVNQTMSIDLLDHLYLSTGVDKSGSTPSRNKIGVSRSTSLRIPLADLQHAAASPAIQFPSTPVRVVADEEAADENDPPELGGIHHHHRIDRVQQYSEKRTHITANDTDLDVRFRRRDSSSVVEGGGPSLSGGRHLSSLLGRQYDSLSEVANLSDDQEQQPCHMKNGSVEGGAGFNMVRKKQLERLNYRSNWFLSPPSGLRQAGLMRVDPLSPGTPRSCLKVPKNEEKEVAIRDYSPTDDRVDLRRKSSNRQQRLLAPSATISGSDDDIGGLPSLYSNAHVPSSSRQFTLDPSTITIGAQDINNTPTVDATSAASESPDHGPPCETRYFVSVKYYGPAPSSLVREALIPPARCDAKN